MFPDALRADARRLLDELRSRRLMLATAESCTGGLIVALMTEFAGSSDVVERGFVTYSNDAKIEAIGVPPEVIARHGAVSEATARAMAEGALVHSEADIAVSVTGIAGPGGGSADKPVGLVHMAVARVGASTLHRECRFGDVGRERVRLETVAAALTLLRQAALTTVEAGPE